MPSKMKPTACRIPMLGKKERAGWEHGACTEGKRGGAWHVGRGKPLLLPSPIIVGARLLVCEVVVDIVFVAKAAGDPVRNAPGRIREFPGIEEHVLRIVSPDTVHH